VVASLYIGNIILLILNLPLIGIWGRITRIPYGILGTLVLLLSFLGTYRENPDKLVWSSVGPSGPSR
jgi:putative tricarboxylic transport membrane protein